jgi:hypothetical protein
MNASLIFLVIVILVTATLVYLYFNKLGPWKKEKSPAPAPAPAPAQTQVLPSITDFSVDRTLSPDGSSEPYTIEPYTIEPYTDADILALSKNVTFTLTWTNGLGFKEAGVNEIKVYHGVKKNDDTTFDNSNDSNDWKLRETLNKTSENANALENFAKVTISISGLDGDGAYSFEGNNFFKIVADYGTGDSSSSIELYNSYTLWKNENDDEKKEKLAIKISSDDLVGTIDMTSSETVTYEPRLDSGTGQTLGRTIDNQYYDFYFYYKESDATPMNLFNNVRLVALDDTGIKFKLEKKCLDENDTLSLCGWYRPLSAQVFGQTLISYGFRKIGDNIIDAIEIEIAESLETDKRGHKKVIMLKANIDGEDKYLFGLDGFKTLNDNSIDTNDKFFRRNIYIKEHGT